jgi:hypothetical protein
MISRERLKEPSKSSDELVGTGLEDDVRPIEHDPADVYEDLTQARER